MPRLRPGGARVTLLTDSAGGVVFWHHEAREELGRGYDLRLEVATCRRLVTESCSYAGEKAPSALEVVQAKSAELGQVVVVAVGYNEGSAGYGADLDRVMLALTAAGVEKVVWLTLRELRPSYEETNLVIREAARRWPTMVVADWNAASKGQDSWFVDGIHMNVEGGFAFVRWLRPIVLAACGTSCAPPAPSRRTSDGAAARARRPVGRRRSVDQRHSRARGTGAGGGSALLDPQLRQGGGDAGVGSSSRSSGSRPLPAAEPSRVARSGRGHLRSLRWQVADPDCAIAGDARHVVKRRRTTPPTRWIVVTRSPS